MNDRLPYPANYSAMNGIKIAIISRVGLAVIGLILSLVIARSLGPSGLGLFSLTVVFASVITSLMQWSIYPANIHYSARYPESRSRLIGNGISVVIIWGGFVAILFGLFLSGLGERFIPEMSSRLWSIALLGVIPLMLQQFGNGFVEGGNEKRGSTGILISRDIFFLVSLLVVMNYDEFSTEGIASIWLGFITLGAVFTMVRIVKFLPHAPQCDWNLLKDTISYNLQRFGMDLLTNLKLNIDPILIIFFLTPSDVGYFALAYILSAGIWYLPWIISRSLFPKGLNFLSNSHWDMTPLIIRLSFSLAIVSAIIMAISSKYLIVLLPGAEFLPAYGVLIILLPGAVLYTLAKMLSGEIRGKETQGYEPAISLTVLILNIVFTIVLIPRFGIYGTAAASSITNAIAGLAYLHFYMVETEYSAVNLLVLQSEDIQEFRSLIS